LNLKNTILLEKKLIESISEINKVSNFEGKGRDDLKIEILIEAEKIMRTVSANTSKSIRFLAERIKNSFWNIRTLLRKYNENIEIVDPQLKNNSDLVECLVNYECLWEKGKEFLINEEKCKQLIKFSQIIEILREKYKEINEQVESRDPTIFVWIPSILVLKSLNNEDCQICKDFNINMYNNEEECGKTYLELKEHYTVLSKDFGDSYALYNLIEKSILFDYNHLDINNKLLLEFNNKLKILAMQLQRAKPSDWNNFIDLAMNYI